MKRSGTVRSGNMVIHVFGVHVKNALHVTYNVCHASAHDCELHMGTVGR